MLTSLRSIFLLLGPLLVLSEASWSTGHKLKLDGDFIQGGMVRGSVTPGAKLKLDELTVMVAEEGAFVFGFGRDYAATALLTVAYPDGRVETHALDVTQREYDIQRVDGLPKSKVIPQTQEQIGHVLRDQNAKREALKSAVHGTWFLESFDWPVVGILTGVYGSQRILNGEPRQPHYGVDIAAPTGTEVIAPAGGVVTLAAPDMYFEGGLVFLDHGYGLTSGFLHMNRIDVAVGDVIKKGQVIGTVGATGRATGAHLDWRVSWSGQQIDPELLVGPMPASRGELVRHGD